MEIYKTMGLPEKARTDRVIFKKQFYENAALSAADRKQFDAVEKIYWRYALKPENAFIQAYADDEREYLEIEVVEANVEGEKSVRRLAEIILRAMPYPLLLFFRRDGKAALFMGKIRSSQADGEKMTVEEIQFSDWLDENAPFWKDMALSKMRTANFLTLYENWFDVLSRYNLEAKTGTGGELSGEEARGTLARLTAIDKEMASLEKQMKKESQFNRKMELNMKLQKLKKERAKIIERGSDES